MAQHDPSNHETSPRGKMLVYALFGLAAFLFVIDFFIHRHVAHPWEAMFGFYAIYGFIGIVVLVMASKFLRTLVMRDEDYYDG